MVLSSLPENNPHEEPPSLDQPSDQVPWRALDLVIFGAFFGLTVLFAPIGIISALRVFNPELRLSDLSAAEQVLVQGIIDVLLVAFIVFLVKVVHQKSFTETIHWFHNHTFRIASLIGSGALLALTVLVTSALFPPSEPPPIEKLISSSGSLYVFVIFGIGVAPLFEEIIFRGFLFKIFADLGGAALAVPSTAVLFTLLHVPQLWGSWAGILLIFVVGYVLSLVRERSNSLIPSLVIHTSYNAMLFGVFALSTFFQRTRG